MWVKSIHRCIVYNIIFTQLDRRFVWFDSRYQNLLVLALWGDTRTVHQAAGRLPEYPTIRGLMA